MLTDRARQSILSSLPNPMPLEYMYTGWEDTDTERRLIDQKAFFGIPSISPKPLFQDALHRWRGRGRPYSIVVQWSISTN